MKPAPMQGQAPGGVRTIAASGYLSRFSLWRTPTWTPGRPTAWKKKRNVGVLFEGNHYRVTHLSERKEKKKKDKVPDVLNRPGIHPEIAKVERKKSKKNGPESSVELGTVSRNPEAEEGKKKRKRGGEDEEPTDKKKKRKREKIPGTISDPASVVPTADLSLEVSGTIVSTSEVKEKKKRRKHKSSEETSCSHTSVAGPAPTAGSPDETEHLRKQKPMKGDTTNVGVEAEFALQTEDRSSRRRKKSKSRQTTYPDPSDDHSLTEQSQKGSYPHPKTLTLLTSLFDDCLSYDLHLFPIHLTRDLEVQQSSPKLGDSQCLDV